MKITQKIIYPLAMLFTNFNAHALVCKTQLIHSACGSGRVEIVLNTHNNTFILHNGDVPCWFSDFEVRGLSKFIQANHPYYLAKSFELIPRDQQTATALLQYDEKLHVAKLSIIKNDPDYPTLSSQYNLVCR